jgi:hypothetical protein
MEECEMTELEKLKAAREVIDRWANDPRVIDMQSWLDSEMTRLEDPFLQAKHLLHNWKSSTTATTSAINLLQYVEHLKNERDHYKIQYEHAKEAAEKS